MERVDEVPETCNSSIRCERPKMHFQVADTPAARAVNKLQAHRHSDCVVAFKEREWLEADELEVRKARKEGRHGISAPSLLEPL